MLVIEQYGTSKESYDFHQKLNNQFAATGSLFDPVQTQVFGNVLCKSDPTKIVYGYFDLNSYAQYRYFFPEPTTKGELIIKQIFRFPDLPDENGMLETQPLKIPPEDPPPPLPPPVWWE
jgi:hypothetical protein